MKIRHLLKSGDFKETVKTGKKYKGELLSLYVKDDSELTELTIGIIISKKFVKRAVTRNYLRRRIYSFYSQTQFKKLTGKRIIVRIIKTVDKQKIRATAKLVRQELERLTLKSEKNNAQNIYN